ncbi:MAG: hypothetical protein ACYDAQ_15355 [Mycobacteriales bacterium]
MANISPRRRRWVPPSPQEKAAAVAEAAARRAELDVAEARRRALRPALLAATGVALADPTAAVECQCGCHPTYDPAGMHDGGASCACQLAPEERHRKREQLFAGLADLFRDPETVAAQAADEQAFEAAAADLAVLEARIVCRYAPFVITGTVDGRAFYLRERHGDYQVTIARDAAPLEGPWESAPQVETIDIAEGTDADFGDPRVGQAMAVRALEAAAAAVRTYLRRASCAHEAPEGARYCPACGTELVSPNQP